jgi:peptide/nickel transport system substrate-binding protein
MTTAHRFRRPRQVAVLAGVALAAITLTACGSSSGASGSSPTDDGGTPVAGGRLKLAFWSDFQGCIDPNQVYWIESRSIDRNIADSLTDQDPETGEIKPWLATKWTVNADATQYTFTLRDGVTFSDGTPLTADSVKQAYDAVKALGAKSTLGLSYLANYKSTTVVDPKTVQVDFSAPNAAFLQATSTTTLAILSASTYAATPEERCAGKVIASGAFTLDNYTAGKAVSITKRTGYKWASPLVKNQGEAHLDGIDVSYIAEDSVRVGSLTSGAIDVAWPRLPISEADQQVIKSAGGSIVTRSLPGPASLLLPNAAPGKVLNDATVRQALNKAIDRKSYAATIFWSEYPAATSVFDTSTPYYKDTSAALAFDLDGANKLLDGAGWAKGSDGIRSKDGKRLTVNYVSNASGPGEQLLQDQLKKAGIDLQIKVLTSAQLTPALTAGDFDLTGSYFTRADPSVLGSVLDQKVTKAYSASFTQDATQAAKVSELFDDGISTIDAKKREAAYGDLQDYLVKEGIAWPLYERLQVVGLAKKVKGFAWTSESFLRANDIWLQS